MKLPFFKKNNKNLMRGSTIKPQNKIQFKQKVLLCGKGKIDFGCNVCIGYFPSPYFYSTYGHIEARNNTSEIYIGKNTAINNNCCILCNSTSIKIGNNCRIGANFQCYDSDFHGLAVENRDNPQFVKNKPVKIGNNVFIGNNVIVLKGVNIGDDAVVGAGSVVLANVEENTIIAGNPAKLIKRIETPKTLVAAERERERERERESSSAKSENNYL